MIPGKYAGDHFHRSQDSKPPPWKTYEVLTLINPAKLAHLREGGESESHGHRAYRLPESRTPYEVSNRRSVCGVAFKTVSVAAAVGLNAQKKPK
jgi:hypothetical protein